MRRKERRIADRKEIDAVIRASQVWRLAMAMENQPYLVPLSFGYDGEAIYSIPQRKTFTCIDPAH